MLGLGCTHRYELSGGNCCHCLAHPRGAACSNPDPNWVRKPSGVWRGGGGVGASSGQAPDSRGGSVGTPTYIPQHGTHDTLIICSIHSWGKKIFRKKFPIGSSSHQPAKVRPGGQVGVGFLCVSPPFMNSPPNSIAFGKSTSQRIYREQHTPKIGWKLHKYRLKHALHTLDDHFR